MIATIYARKSTDSDPEESMGQLHQRGQTYRWIEERAR
jgi:hypothetical protein